MELSKVKVQFPWSLENLDGIVTTEDFKQIKVYPSEAQVLTGLSAELICFEVETDEITKTPRTTTVTVKFEI